MSRTLSLLALVFFGPLLAAVIAYYGPWQWAPRAAHGELIEPPIPLPPGVLTSAAAGEAPSEPPRARWFLIYARTAPCTDECSEQMIRLVQVRLALAEDADRVQLVSLLTGPSLEQLAQPGWLVVDVDASRGAGVTELLGREALLRGRVYIGDATGNLVMSYPPNAEQKGILEDLERLLELSASG